MINIYLFIGIKYPMDYTLTGLILLYADKKSIKNYCRTSKIARQICNSIDFWLEKFNHDNIPIIDLNPIKTGNDFMREYIKVQQSQQKTKYIIDNNEIGFSIIEFEMDIEDVNHLKIFPTKIQQSLLEHIKEHINTRVINNFGNNHNLIYRKTQNIATISMMISKHTDVFVLLQKLFYYYPDIEIYNLFKRKINFNL